MCLSCKTDDLMFACVDAAHERGRLDLNGRTAAVPIRIMETCTAAHIWQLVLCEGFKASGMPRSDSSHSLPTGVMVVKATTT